MTFATSECSFSTVSKPMFARKYSLESSWRDLQGLHAFAPLRPQYFSKTSSIFWAFSTLEMLKCLKSLIFESSSLVKLVFTDFHEMSNVECRMSRMVRKTPWTPSKVPSAPFWYSPVGREKGKRKRKNEGQSDMGENNGAHRNPLCTYWLSRKRALCVTCEQSKTGQSIPRHW